MLQKGAILLLGLLLLIPQSCSEDSIDDPLEDTGGESILISNFTGHLVRRSGVRCGPGIKVVFVLTSALDKREYIYEPDTYRSVPIRVDRGTNLRVQAFQIDGDRRTLLTQSTVTFSPPDDSNLQVRPEIILCPSDRLQFYDFAEG